MRRLHRFCPFAIIVCLGMPLASYARHTTAAAAPDRSPGPEVHFRVGESALFELLRAATPYTVTVGNEFVGVDLVLSDPKDFVLREGKATFSIRVRGRTLPFDRTLEPVVTVEYDAHQRQYFVVVSSLPLRLPLIGPVDLRDALPRVTLPGLVERLWYHEDRPIGMRALIRRVAILDRRVEIDADVEFKPVPRSRMPRR